MWFPFFRMGLGVGVPVELIGDRDAATSPPGSVLNFQKGIYEIQAVCSLLNVSSTSGMEEP